MAGQRLGELRHRRRDASERGPPSPRRRGARAAPSRPPALRSAGRPPLTDRARQRPWSVNRCELQSPSRFLPYRDPRHGDRGGPRRPARRACRRPAIARSRRPPFRRGRGPALHLRGRRGLRDGDRHSGPHHCGDRPDPLRCLGAIAAADASTAAAAARLRGRLSSTMLRVLRFGAATWPFSCQGTGSIALAPRSCLASTATRLWLLACCA
jgi:hypothetical protein